MLERSHSIVSPQKGPLGLHYYAHKVLVVSGGKVVQFCVDTLKVVLQASVNKLCKLGGIPNLLDNLVVSR